jgi:hypothetical protein
VLEWTCTDVALWCSTIGMPSLVDIVNTLMIDGDVLLRLSDDELKSFVLLSKQNLLPYIRSKIEDLRLTVLEQ